MHTKPWQEKATTRHLLAHRIAFYLPQVVHESRTPSGRKTRSIRPLFTSYVFMRGDEHKRIEAFRGDTLAIILEVADQGTLHKDLEKIYRMLASGLPVSLEPSHPIGVRVRITGGPLAGLEGTVIRRGPRDRFVAVVNFLGRGGVVDLQDWEAEPIADLG